MIRFELKKIFLSTGNRIALLVLGLFLAALSVYVVSSIHYVEYDGNSHKGLGAIRELRQEYEEWEGEITEEKIALAIEREKEINGQYELDERENLQESNQNFARKQGYAELREMINSAFCGFREYDYYKIGNLEPGQAAEFYSRRTEQLREYLEGEGKEGYTEEEKAYLLSQYEELEIPFTYTWTTNWEQFFLYFPTVLAFTVLVLGFLLARIFPGEFRYRAAPVYYASMHGRGKAVLAKLKAGLFVTTGIYWAAALLFSAVIFGCLGFSDPGVELQTVFGYWKSYYNISVGQAYLLTVFGGYVGTLFFALFTMLLSAWTKSSLLAAAVPCVLLLVPDFLSSIPGRLAGLILGLLPDQAVQISNVLSQFRIYSIGGQMVPAASVLLVLYSLLSLFLLPLIYRVYKTRER